MVICDEVDVLIPASSTPYQRKKLRERELKHPWSTCLFLEKVYDAVETRLIAEQKTPAPAIPDCFWQGPWTQRAVFAGRLPKPLLEEAVRPGQLSLEYLAHLQRLESEALSGNETSGKELEKALALLPEHSQPSTALTQRPDLDPILDTQPYPKQPVQLVLCSAAASSQHRSPFHRWVFEHSHRVKRVAPVHYEHWYGDLPQNLEHIFVECALPTARWDPHLTPALLRRGQAGSVWALRAHIRGLERMARPVLDAHARLQTQRQEIKREMQDLGRRLAELRIQEFRERQAQGEQDIEIPGITGDIMRNPDKLLRNKAKQLRLAVRHRHRVLRGLEEEIEGLTRLPSEDFFRPAVPEPSGMTQEQDIQDIYNPNPRLVPRELITELPGGGLRGRVLVLVPPPYSAANLARVLRDLDLPAEELKPKSRLEEVLKHSETSQGNSVKRGKGKMKRGRGAAPHQETFSESGSPEPVLEFLTLGWDEVRGIDIPELRHVIILAPNEEMLRNSTHTSIVDGAQRTRLRLRQQQQRVYEARFLKVQGKLNRVRRRIRYFRKRDLPVRDTWLEQEKLFLEQLRDIDVNVKKWSAPGEEGEEKKLQRNGDKVSSSPQQQLEEGDGRGRRRQKRKPRREETREESEKPIWTPVSEFLGTSIEMQAPPKLHSRIYGHLAGRSARAGRSGVSITLFSSDHFERKLQNWDLDPRAFGGETGIPTPVPGSALDPILQQRLQKAEEKRRAAETDDRNQERGREMEEEDIEEEMEEDMEEERGATSGYDPTRPKQWNAATPNEHIVRKLERQLNIRFRELILDSGPDGSRDPVTGIDLDSLDDEEHMRFVLGGLGGTGGGGGEGALGMMAMEDIDESAFIEVPDLEGQEEEEVDDDDGGDMFPAAAGEAEELVSDSELIAEDPELEAQVRRELDEMMMDWDAEEGMEGMEAMDEETDIAVDEVEGREEEESEGLIREPEEEDEDGSGEVVEEMDEEGLRAYQLLQEIAAAEGLSQTDIDQMFSELLDEKGEFDEEQFTEWLQTAEMQEDREEEAEEEESGIHDEDIPSDRELEAMLRDADFTEFAAGESNPVSGVEEEFEAEFSELDSKV